MQAVKAALDRDVESAPLGMVFERDLGLEVGPIGGLLDLRAPVRVFSGPRRETKSRRWDLTEGGVLAMVNQVADGEPELFLLRVEADQGESCLVSLVLKVDGQGTPGLKAHPRPFSTASYAGHARRLGLVLGSAAVLTSTVTVLADPQETGSAPLRVLRREITSETRLAVDRGLDYLIGQRGRTGDFGAEFPVACDALAGLAFLSGGYTPRDGRYADILQETIEALLRYQRDNGYFDDRSRGSRMYGHGFATLFLAQVYGLAGEQDRRVGKALKRAVKLIESAQCRDGGWDYYPSRQFATEKFLGISVYTGTSDTSITVCQTMALRAARNLGISIDPQVIARARAFIEKSQNRDGGFAYRRGVAFGGHLAASDFPRSAAGVCILLSLGEYKTSRIERGFEYLMRTYEKRSDFPYYADYYCTQAMFQAGGRRWREYYPWVRRKLLDRQQRNGSWKSTSYGCPEHATAMALIVLQAPYRFLPIHER